MHRITLPLLLLAALTFFAGLGRGAITGRSADDWASIDLTSIVVSGEDLRRDAAALALSLRAKKPLRDVDVPPFEEARG